MRYTTNYKRTRMQNGQHIELNIIVDDKVAMPVHYEVGLNKGFEFSTLWSGESFSEAMAAFPPEAISR